MPDRFQPARDLLEGITLTEARALGIRALREWKTEHGDERSFQLHGALGLHALKFLAEEKGVASTFDHIGQKEVFLQEQRADFMAPFLEFVWWLVRAGLAVPAAAYQGGELVTLLLTEAGQQFFRRKVEDHPLFPGFVRRLMRRCPGFPVEVANYLGDAQDCFEHGLRRPSAILAGLAVEKMVEDVLEDFATKGHPSKATNKAGERVAQLRVKATLLKLSNDENNLSTAAIDFADHIRRRRNDGAHGEGLPFDDDAEIEELLLSTGRHLEVLWRLTTATFKAA